MMKKGVHGQWPTQEKFPELSGTKQQTKLLAIFASGAGSNAQKIIEHFKIQHWQELI